jgi:MoaA/NifB/PqqE/SkfB family radical SAM enzyme
MDSKCILPWIHIESTSTGHVRPCCLYRGSIEIDGKSISLDKFSLLDAWQSQYMNDLRQSFLRGEKPEGCLSCWEMEESGKTSKRQISLQQYSHRLDRFNSPVQMPIYLDLKLGTVCNLKCRSCSSFSSSKWASDEIKIYGKSMNSNLHSYWIEEDSPLWNDLKEILPFIEHFDFTGGEPFLVKKHFDILKICVDKNYAKDITIHYNTNGTVMPTDEMFDIWKQFKNVEMMFSIDGVGDKFEYLRHPGKWGDLLAVFEKVKSLEIFYVNMCYSVTVFNILYVKEFVKWFQQHNLPADRLYFNLIWKPEYLNIKNMSPESKTKIKLYLDSINIDDRYFNDRIQELLNFMFDGGDNLELEFIKRTQQLDLIRGEDFSKVFSELAEILL